MISFYAKNKKLKTTPIKYILWIILAISRRIDEASQMPVPTSEDTSFKRKLSKREKKVSDLSVTLSVSPLSLSSLSLARVLSLSFNLYLSYSLSLCLYLSSFSLHLSSYLSLVIFLYLSFTLVLFFLSILLSLFLFLTLRIGLVRNIQDCHG